MLKWAISPPESITRTMSMTAFVMALFPVLLWLRRAILP